MIRECGGGAVFRTALTLSVIKLVCFSFVDDDNVVTTGEDVKDAGESLIEKSQMTLDQKMEAYTHQAVPFPWINASGD